MSGQFPFGFTPPDPDDEGSGASGSPNFDSGQFGAMLESLGRMMQTPSSSGPVNWAMAQSLARQAVSQEGDPTPTSDLKRAIADSVRLSELWLDEQTTFPSTASEARAWSRAEWIDGTLAAWKPFIEPIAEQAQNTMGGMLDGQDAGFSLDALPPELRQALPEGMDLNLSEMLAPLMGMAQQMGSAMFATQAGQGLGSLAQEVFGASDIGVPLTTDGIPTLIPHNISDFAEGLGVDKGEVLIFLALREAAHQRLFTHVAWLRPRLHAAVEAYARGIHVDTDRITEAMGEIDATNPEAMQEIMSSGVFEPQDTADQEAAKARLETLLALVEGWVDAVVADAAADRLPSIVALGEAMRRRRAAGGPAEKTFATLLGLEMRPRKLREAAHFWSRAAQEDAAERDRLWGHPDLLPTTEDLDDPDSFFARSTWDVAAAIAAATPNASEAEEPGTESGQEGQSDPDSGADGAQEPGPDASSPDSDEGPTAG